MLSFLKRFTPKGLFGRTFMIMVVPLILLQVVIAALFLQRHVNGVSRQMAENVASELIYLKGTIETLTKSERPLVLERIAHDLGYTIAITPNNNYSVPQKIPVYRLQLRALQSALDRTFPYPYGVNGDSHPKTVLIYFGLQNFSDEILIAKVPYSRLFARNSHLLFVWMLVASVMLCAIGVLFLHQQIKPIRKLAKVADAYGRGLEAPAIAIRGAAEIRMAALAFQRMRLRIDRHIEQRTLMLSSVSHDLRTPLTRMKLALELSDDIETQQELLQDINSMQHLIDEYLAFAKGDNLESPERLNLNKLLENLCKAYPQDALTLNMPEKSIFMKLRSGAIYRCIQNLLDNALHYGEHAWIQITPYPNRCEILIDDNGIGIPPEQYHNAFQPFFRLDESRNQNNSGVGLGLAIALDAARLHGGDIKLQQSPYGGLRVAITLPKEALI